MAAPPPGREPATGEPVIQAIGLTKRYGDRTAVDDLSFEVRPGEVFGLLGPNGAGKTTTVLMLLGLTDPSEGEARVVGVDPARDPLEVKRHVGYMPDAVGFYDGMTGRQNLSFTAQLNRIPRAIAAERIADLSTQAGLADAIDMRVETYSRGMRQRLGIADALLKEPSVLILDEPTASLDPEGVAELLSLIDRIAAERSIAVLLSSHLLDQVQAICHRVGIFYQGRLIAEGTVRDLAASGPRSVDEVELAVRDGAGAAVPFERLAQVLEVVPGVSSIVPDTAIMGALLVTGRPGIAGDLAAAVGSAGLRPVHLRTREERLDTIYRRLVHAAADAAPERRRARASSATADARPGDAVEAATRTSPARPGPATPPRIRPHRGQRPENRSRPADPGGSAPGAGRPAPADAPDATEPGNGGDA